jgi:hypothetical protein
MRGDRGQITGLSEAIEALRSQLIEAIDKGEDQPMRFSLEPIELTLQAVITTGGDGKIGWGVLGVGAERRSETTQSLKLSLRPVWRTSDGTYTSDFTIGSQVDSSPHVGPARGQS